MTRETLQVPTARTWRDIPQPVVPRAMSREGRWRLVKSSLRIAAVLAICVVAAWGIRIVAGSLDENARLMPATAKATPIKPPELQTDGVLDNAWLARRLALPRHASLLELDLQLLRARLLADDQVVSASVTRIFPDRLVAQITERSPVARVMTEYYGQQKAFLVARDGVIYDGTNYQPAVIDSLPWLDGVQITPRGGKFQPIAGMDEAAELLAKARLEAEHLYANWSVLSLAHLDSDQQLEVRTKNGLRIVFSTRDDYFRQLAKLNYIVDQMAKMPVASATIDLSLGQDVPVMVEAAPSPTPPRESAPLRTAPNPELQLLPGRRITSEPALFVLPSPTPSKFKREL